METKGVPRILTSAWLREVHRGASCFVLDRCVTSDPVRRTRSLLQGDPAAPTIFNATLDIPTTEFLHLAKQRGWGYKLGDGSYLSLVLFADNYWLIGTSPQELGKMTTAWLSILKKYGWSTPLQECTWCTTGLDETSSWQVAVDGSPIKRTSRKVGFNVLGVQLTFDNCFEVELQNRIGRAWRAFYKYAHLLCCQRAPLGNRFQLLQSLVSTSLFWCAGSWNLTAKQASKLRGVQQDMLQKMVRLSRRPGKETDDYMYRLRLKIKRLKDTHSFIDWDRRAYSSMFSWAGHVARIGQYDAGRITYRILQHKSWEWIQTVARANNGNQTHGRRLKVWRWEAPMYKFFKKVSWQEVAQNKESWNQQLESMIDWRCRRR
jgi:hypothetical protein